MSTYTAILEPESDGCVRVPVPQELRHGKIRLTATLEHAEIDTEKNPARLVPSQYGGMVLVAPIGAPTMTPELLRTLRDDDHG